MDPEVTQTWSGNGSIWVVYKRNEETTSMRATQTRPDEHRESLAVFLLHGLRETSKMLSLF
jgi:hypothetical protein